MVDAVDLHGTLPKGCLQLAMRPMVPPAGSGERDAALGELGFIDGEAETRRGRQLKETVDRDRRVVEDGVRARRRVVPFAGLCHVQLACRDMQACHVPDHRLCLMRHELDPMRLRLRGAALKAGDAAHLYDVRLDHAHARGDQIGEPRERIGLLAGRNRDVETLRDLAHRLDMIMLHRLLEPPIAELFEGAADADRAARRVAVVGIEGERETVADELAHRLRLGDVARNVEVEAGAVVVEADLDRGRVVPEGGFSDGTYLNVYLQS